MGDHVDANGERFPLGSGARREIGARVQMIGAAGQSPPTLISQRKETKAGVV